MRILFVTASRIGDAVLSTALLAHVIERHPGARLTIACGPAAAPLFEAAPGLERVIVLVKRRWGAHWLSLWAATVGTRWDLVVDLRASALAWTGEVRTGHVMAVASLSGLVFAFEIPTRQSFVVEIVGKEHLGNAIALSELCEMLAVTLWRRRGPRGAFRQRPRT